MCPNTPVESWEGSGFKSLGLRVIGYMQARYREIRLDSDKDYSELSGVT